MKKKKNRTHDISKLYLVRAITGMSKTLDYFQPVSIKPILLLADKILRLLGVLGRCIIHSPDVLSRSSPPPDRFRLSMWGQIHDSEGVRVYDEKKRRNHIVGTF